MRQLALTLIFVVISAAAFAGFGRSTSFDDRELCERDKGVWRQFGNSTADSCEAKMDRFAIASRTLNYACDCGKGRCWDGNYCASMMDYKKTYDKNQEKEQQKVAEAKKKRQGEYRDNVNSRLRDLIQSASATNGADANNGVELPSNNNMAQFADKIPQEDVTLKDMNAVNNTISQKTQAVVDQGSEAVKKVQSGAFGKIFSLPKTETAATNPQAAPTDTATATSTTPAGQDPSDPSLSNPTPFFLQQQAKAKQESDAIAAQAAKSGITIFDPTKPNLPDTSTSDLPGLPQIPLPQ